MDDDDLENPTTPATLVQLLKIAEALGLTMNGIECVPIHELMSWCEIAAEVRLEARRQDREAELLTPEGFSRWTSFVMGQRAAEAAAGVRVPRVH